MARVVVLYEDALAPGTQPRDYGPHALLLWCLVDRTGQAFWDLAKRVEGNARKIESIPVALIDLGDGLRLVGPKQHVAARAARAYAERRAPGASPHNADAL